MKDFLIIAITRPEFYSIESECINSLLQNEKVDYLHLRKPFSEKEDMDRLLREINPDYYSKIKLHDHFEFVEKYNLGGYHINQRNRNIGNVDEKNVSISLHSIEEMEKLDFNPDYFFLSPIYDSISKPGYKSTFNLSELSTRIRHKRAVALGGVTPDKFEELKELGFVGGALLSHFFPQPH